MFIVDFVRTGRKESVDLPDCLDKIEEEVNDSLEEETSELSFLSKWVDMQLTPRITSTLPTSRTASIGC